MTNWLTKFGSIILVAWGRIILRMVFPYEIPRLRLASICPAGTAWIPPRTISAIYAPALSDRAIVPATKSLIGLCWPVIDSRRFGIPQKMKAARIISGIPRITSTKISEMMRSALIGLTLNIPKIIPITIAMAKEISAKAMVIPSPLKSCL